MSILLIVTIPIVILMIVLTFYKPESNVIFAFSMIVFLLSIFIFVGSTKSYTEKSYDIKPIVYFDEDIVEYEHNGKVYKEKYKNTKKVKITGRWKLIVSTNDWGYKKHDLEYYDSESKILNFKDTVIVEDKKIEKEIELNKNVTNIKIK